MYSNISYPLDFCRFAKKCHSDQLKVLSKFNRAYFEMENHLKVDKAAYITMENGNQSEKKFFNFLLSTYLTFSPPRNKKTL